MFYVRAGLTIAEVTYLGRWHSDLVFQYGEEAWETRPANYGTMAQPRAIETAQEASDVPEPHGMKHTAHKERMAPGADLAPTSSSRAKFVEDLGASQPKWIRASGRSKVAHLLGEGTGSSATWKTKCGWTFARASHFILTVEQPPGVPRCAKCRLNVDRTRGKPDER